MKEWGLVARTAADALRLTALLEPIADQTDRLTFPKFLTLIDAMRTEKKKLVYENHLKLFRKYDKDLSGLLTMSEITMLLGDVGMVPKNKTEQEHLRIMVAMADKDRSGQLDFAEFQDLFQRIEERLQASKIQEEAVHAKDLGFTVEQTKEFRW